MPPDTQWIVLAARLRELVTSEYWDTYTEQIGMLENEAVHDWVSGKPGVDEAYQRGFINGLRTAIYHPSKLIDRVKEMK